MLYLPSPLSRYFHNSDTSYISSLPLTVGRRREGHGHEVEVGVVVAAALLPGGRVGGVVVPVRRRVEAELGPDEEAVVEGAAEHDVVGERVVVGRGRVPGEPVVEVGRVRDRVGDVRRRGLDRVAQGLVEEELRQVRDGAARVRAVGQDRGAHVRDQVLVRRPPLVVPGEDGVEGDDAVCVRLLHASKVRRAETPLAPRAHAAVRPRRVAAPRVDQDALGRLAGLYVYELHLEVQRYPHHPLRYVTANVLLVHEVRPVGVVRRQDAARVRPEDVAVGRVLVEVVRARLVVRLRRPLLERRGVSAVQPGGWFDLYLVGCQ